MLLSKRISCSKHEDVVYFLTSHDDLLNFVICVVSCRCYHLQATEKEEIENDFLDRDFSRIVPNVGNL